MDTLKAVGVVDFTKYAPSPIIQYVQRSKLPKLNLCKFVKIILGIILVLLHAPPQYVCNIPIKN